MTNEFDDDATADATVRGAMGKTFRDADGVRLLIQEPLGDGLLNVRNLETGGPYQPRVDGLPGSRTMTDVLWLESWLSEGRLFELHKVDAGLFRHELDENEAERRDPKARARVTVVKELVSRGFHKDSPRLSKAVAEIWKSHKFDEKFGDRPETKVVRTWFRGDVETITIHDLVSKSGRVPRRSRVDAEVEPILDAAAEHFWDAPGIRQIDARAKLAADGKALNADRAKQGLARVPIPSRETLRKRIARKLDREHYARKYGEAAARKNFDGHGIGLVAERIGQIGVIDDTVLDAVACFDGVRGLPAGRPYLCLLVDVASRCIVGYLLSFAPPNAHTALETIRAASRYKRAPKELLEQYPVLRRINCRFEEIVSDRGSNYTSTSFGQALLDVGTTLRLVRRKRPRDKAIVERIFHTLKTFILDKLPGATFAPALMREFDIDPEKTACLTVSELVEIIEHFIAVYHITVHSTIKMQPALFWNRSLAAHGRHLLLDPERFGILSGETLFGVRFDREGASLDGIRYVHEDNVEILIDAMAGAQAAGDIELYEDPDAPRPRRRRRAAGLGNVAAWATAKVKRNTANLGRIHAYVPGHGWLPFGAANAEYADGLSLYQHKRIAEWAKKRAMDFSTEEDQLAARHALVEHVRRLAPDLKTRDRRAVARMTRDGNPGGGEDFVDYGDEPGERDADDAAIDAAPIDDRTDAEIDPKPKKGGRGGRASSTDDEPAEEVAAQIEELMAASWDQPEDDDRRFEERG